MIGKVVLATLVAAGCAAAVPAVHDTVGGHMAAMHGGAHHGPHGVEGMRAHVDGALDTLGLAPERKAKAKAILESHFDEAQSLHERIRSGELDHDGAMAEHERLLAKVKTELAPVLSEDEIRRLHEALHPQSAK